MSSFYSEKELKTIGFKKFGKNVLISRYAIFYAPENITLKSNLRIDDYSIISAVNGICNIGNFVHIGAFSYIQASGEVIIKDFSGLSQGCKVYTKSSDFVNQLTNSMIPKKFTKSIIGKVTLGTNSDVGANTVILPGVTIAEGVAIGANSLVLKTLNNKWSLYFGSPARFVKKRNKKNILIHKKKLLKFFKKKG
jgi:galactoside O-acetyltransferase